MAGAILLLCFLTCHCSCVFFKPSDRREIESLCCGAWLHLYDMENPIFVAEVGVICTMMLNLSDNLYAVLEEHDSVMKVPYFLFRFQMHNLQYAACD